ncbi:MAG TPA: ChbG/HpnK family deacetylase [Terriglobales bacterium]|nr:ChbG/HpnK family deacetylase [Terriglobales bacterium]
MVEQDSVKDPLLRKNSVSLGELPGTPRPSQSALGGCLIINADDWGRDAHTTDRTFECFQHGVLSSASGMVFMQDSDRAASIAAAQGLDVGLHLNLSTPFSAAHISTRLATHHQKVREYLCAHRFARLLYHPALANSFEYAVARQLEEFTRLYGRTPDRIDGHHHMHLAANVLLQGLLPSGTIVRRHFSYEPGEKIFRNSVFRLFSRGLLDGRNRITDFFFSLPPFAPPVRIQRIFNLARRFVVEVETHPINAEEYQVLTGGDLLRWTTGCPPALNFSKAVAMRRA